MPAMLHRRQTLSVGAALALGGIFAAPRALRAAEGPFTLPPLPYGPQANEPHIDAQTMSLHHDRHHAGYVSKLNAALKDHGQLAALPLAQLLRKLDEAPDSVRLALRNNGGGHANHSMFWSVMGGQGGAPQGALAEAVQRDFGGLDELKRRFNAAGAGLFGSGWVFVTVTRQGGLALTTRPNQDTPLMLGESVLMGNDVWEHAYYLKYNNRRDDYLKAWWEVLNWPAIGERYEAARQGSLSL